MTAEMSVLDLLMDRNDPSLSLDLKAEPESMNLDMAIKDTDMEWPDPSDDFLNCILDGDNLDSPLLDPLEGMLENTYADIGVSSASSDSGLSSEMSLEQQLSPVPQGLSPLPSSDVASDSESSSTVEMASMGDVRVQDNQAIISMKLVSPSDTNNSQKIRRIIRMTPVSSSTDVKQRSILLPVSSLKGGTNLRTIRIINATPGSRLPAGLRVVCSKSASPPIQAASLSSSTECPSSEVHSDTCSEDSDGPQYPRLDLSDEEKRLLKKEGISLPTHYPLTKMEERELKRIRRKIRNKISAQDSRKRKKEYVDGLEERVRRCTDENANLQKRVKLLQSQNVSLVAQVKRLQAMLTQGAATRQVQPATCLMVLLLSLALVVVPNLRPGQNSTSLEESELNLPADKPTPVAGRSRTLLYKYPVCNDELPFNVEGEEVVEELCSLRDHDYEPPAKIARGKDAVPIDFLDVDDVWPPPKAPPDVTQHNSISSSLDGKWNLQETLSQKIDAVVDEMRPNSTSETRTVLLSITNEK